MSSRGWRTESSTLFFVFRPCEAVSLKIRGRDEERFTLHGHTHAVSTMPGKGVFQGEEAVLADSGRAGEIAAGGLAGEESDCNRSVIPQDAQKGQTSHPPNPGAPRRALS